MILALIMTAAIANKTHQLKPDTDITPEDTRQQLIDFYDLSGGPENFPASYKNTIETVLAIQDDIVMGDYSSAKVKVDGLIEQQPLSSGVWYNGVNLFELNVGYPIGYYAFRMLDQIVNSGELKTRGEFNFTALVAVCASVRRPTLPDIEAEVVDLTIDPALLADNYRIMYQSTDIFRRWFKAITGGYELNMTVVEMSGCATVDYTVRSYAYVSYPDSNAMISSMPSELVNNTDLWWVVAPSGVPGDGSGFDRDFITGGMGLYGLTRAPVILSDDAWFTRKPSHLGNGSYSEVERRIYQPQWFQHEYMHHLFRTWPELGLEEEGHQWFDRSTWPSDFVGNIEPDYYAEAIKKRFFDVTPTLAEGLKIIPTGNLRVVNFNKVSLDIINGDYQRMPVENGFHEITVSSVDATSSLWLNAANFSWQLNNIDGELFTAPESAYGQRPVQVLINDDGIVEQLVFYGESYKRISE